MAQQETFIPPPIPDLDPKWWLLNERAGWRVNFLDKVEMGSGGTLVLKPLAGSVRGLAEPGGSFGGLTTPSNVAVAPNGSVYLLDLEAAQLKRFDPCTCRFEVVPCITGHGKGPRQVLNPHGIGILDGNLYICDSGNRQVKIFSLYGLVLRAIWMPPATSPLRATWQPYDVAFDARGRVFVSDPANGLVHRFTPTGRWIDPPFSGLGAARDLAMSCEGYLYVMTTGDSGAPEVVVLDREGTPVPDGGNRRPDEIAASFPPIPFPVDAKGNIYLEALCVDTAGQPTGCKREPVDRRAQRSAGCLDHPPDAAAARGTIKAAVRGVFDRRGNPVKDPPQAVSAAYELKGYYYSLALDSELYRCQWHRVILTGQIPAGARVRVWTYTSESAQTPDSILALEDEWQTGSIIVGQDGVPERDCLVRSGEGRYLWLRLEFSSNGTATPVLERVRIEYPRISLRRYLPAVFAADPASTDFTDRFLSLFDTSLRSIESEIDTQARFFDPMSTPAIVDRGTGVDFLSWLASWIGLVLDRQLPEARQRQLVKQATRLYPIRGTREGLRRQLLFYLGMDAGNPEGKNGNICGCGNCRNERHATALTCHPRPANCLPPEPPDHSSPIGTIGEKESHELPQLILEHYQLRRWLFASSGRLGDQSVLWGRSIINRSQLDENAQVDRSQLITLPDPLHDPFLFYAHKFTVFIPAWVGRSARYKRGLENLVRAEAPAHTLGDIRYVEPRFRIGVQSTIGFDAVVGCYPQGVTLNETTLGPASVLPEPPRVSGGPSPSLSVGKNTRIGEGRLG
jgi:phage tail-like protein